MLDYLISVVLVVILLFLAAIYHRLQRLEISQGEIDKLINRLWKIPDTYAAPGKELAHAIRQIILEYQEREQKVWEDCGKLEKKQEEEKK